MRKILTILMLLLAVAGCSKDKSEGFDYNDVLLGDESEVTRVLFSSVGGDEVTLTVAMMTNWVITVESDRGTAEADWGFTLSQRSGKANCNEQLTIKSTQSNDTQYTNLLGCLNICSEASGELLYSINIEQSRKPAAQTTLIYFSGTSLRGDFLQNIADAKVAIKSGVLGSSNGRYLYLLPSSYYKATLIEVTLENGVCVETEVESYADLNTLSEGSFSRVLARVKEHIDFDTKVDGVEQRLNLVMSGHGTGWILSTSGQLSAAAGVGEYVSEWEPINPVIPTRYIGASSDGYSNISEFVAELEVADTHFGYILFDMCFMSSVEVLYRIRDYTDYVVASPCEVMGCGFPYEFVMPYMFTEGGANYDLEGICKAYHEYYTNHTSVPYGCVAVCVTGELEALAKAQKALNLRTLSTAEIEGLQSYEGRTGDHLFFDLKQYVNLAGDSASASLLAAYNTQYDKAFPESCRLHTDYFYTGIDGDAGRTGATKIDYYSGVMTSAPITSASKYYITWGFEWWALATAN